MQWGYSKPALFVVFLIPCLAFAATEKKRHDFSSKAWTTKYDSHFRKYTKRYFGPNFDWHWFRSQGIAESGLKNEAQSGVGAVGIMQILPSTYAEIHKKSPYLSAGTLFDPRWNIAAGIFYDRILFKRWAKTLEYSTTENDLYMTFASYNAGHGRIKRVLKKTQNKPGSYDTFDSWGVIKPHVPLETRHYVKRIQFLMDK